ncbi:PE family protein [Mycobacterium asiaticum]|uniref:PE family protein n=1 Tax=Mycobacterium asiaticum TaxID=1790 RepID=UPI000684C726|nr:PE family protein [Mycobacterium asiaticum]ORA17917.1 PE family protein [Mycobacterium asiaticum DSM 44297]
MSYVIAATEYVAAAAMDLANIGSAISDASAAAASPTSGVLIPAGADAVSAEMAALFGAHAQAFQQIAAQAASFHDQFVHLMNLGSQQYALSEAANVSSIQSGTTNLPQQTLGHSVLGEGAHAAPAAAAAAPTMTISPAAAGPVGSAIAPAATPVGSVGSAVAAGSAGSAKRQPIPSLPTSPPESTEVQTAAVSALPAPLAARAAAAAAPAAPAAPRFEATGESAAAAG